MVEQNCHKVVSLTSCGPFKMNSLDNSSPPSKKLNPGVKKGTREIHLRTSRKKVNKFKGRRGNNNRVNRKLLVTQEEIPVRPESATNRKIRLSEDLKIPADSDTGNRLVHFSSVFSAISLQVKCQKCGSEVRFEENDVRGLGFKLKITCAMQCDQKLIPSSPLIGSRYEINTRSVLAMRPLGVGHTGLSKFCGVMDLPKPISDTTYGVLTKNISEVTKDVAKLSMSRRKRKAEEEAAISEEGALYGPGIDQPW